MIMKNKLENYLIIVLNLLICIYFIILAYFSRPHFDDLHFMWQMRDNSLFHFISFNYFEWSGRYFGYFFVGLIDLLQYEAGGNLLFPFIFGIIGFAITYYTLKRVSNLNKWFQFNLIFLFYWIYIFTTFDFAAFTWYCAMAYFLIGPVHLFFVYSINNLNKISIKYLPFLILACLFLGAGYEGYTPIVFLISAVNLVVILNSYNWSILSTLNDIRIKKIILYNLLIFIFFIFVIIAPGNYVRMNSLNEFNVSLSALQFSKSVIQASFLFAYFSIFNLFYYLFVFILTLYYALNNRSSIEQLIVSTKQLTAISLLFVLICILNTLVPVYLWGDFGVYRHYTPLNFFTILLIAYFGLHIGYHIKKSITKTTRCLTLSTLIILIIISVFNIINDTPITKAYAHEVDDRINMLINYNSKGQKEKLEIKPIKNIPYTTDTKYLFFKTIGIDKNKPVLYYISDVDSVVLDYSIHMRKLYNLNFDIVSMKQR